MANGGNYIEIAGGSITETYVDDCSMYAEGSIKTYGNIISETGVENGVGFYAADEAPPLILLSKCIVQFRPQDDWKGEFGFDWYRIGDTSIAGDVLYDTIVGRYYTDVISYQWVRLNPLQNEWYVPKTNANHLPLNNDEYSEFWQLDPQPAPFASQCKTLQDLKNEYGYENYSIKNDREDKPIIKKYYKPIIALFSQSCGLGTYQATLKIKLEFERANKPDKIVFELDNVLMDASHPLVSIDKHTISKNDLGHSEDIIITCKADFADDKEMLVWAITVDPVTKKEIRLQAGILRIVAPLKRRVLDVVLVSVITDAGKGENKSLDEFKRNLAQALITVNITNNNANDTPLKLDVTDSTQNYNNYDFDIRFKVDDEIIKDKDDLADFLNRQFELIYPAKHMNSFKLYFIANVCLDKGLKTLGFSERSTSFGVMFSGHSPTTIGHECMHGLGLPHSFYSLAPYTYKAMYTENIMDYSHNTVNPITMMERTSIDRISTWQWQWKILQSNHCLKSL